VLPDEVHRLGDGVVGAGLRRGDRPGVLGDFIEVRLDVLDEALGFVEGRVGLLLQAAFEFLLAVRDEGGGQLVVHDGRGLPLIAGGAQPLMLFDGRAGEESGLLVLAPGDPEGDGLPRGERRLPVLLRPGAAGRDIRHGHGARLFRLVDHLTV
jgi:hypothetical protein